MSPVYNYQENFWDEHDQGVHVLIQHVGKGISSCELLLDLFQKRSELEMDYARRMGAMSERMRSNLQANPDYNNMSHCLKYLKDSQQRVADAHSLAGERLKRENLNAMKDFLKQFRAKWSTIKNNVESLRKMKGEKKKCLQELDKELEHGLIKQRDCKMNMDTVIGQYQRKENARELEKWTSIVEESQRRKSVLSHEFKAARHHWFEEWRRISGDLQDLETQRVQLSRQLLQQYAEYSSQPSEFELSMMEQFKQKLSSFTPELEISHFAYHHGTGRIKLKNGDSTSKGTSINPTQNDRYVQTVKRLSTQLKTSKTSSSSLAKTSQYFPQVSPSGRVATSTIDMTSSVENNLAMQLQETQLNEPPEPKQNPTLSESSEETSSNPTDFTHAKNKPSYDSMSTSLSSMASSIDDSQRIAKSWNSQNRRKCRSMLVSSQTSDMVEKPIDDENHPVTATSRRRKSIALDIDSAIEIMESDRVREGTIRTASNASSNLTVNRTTLPTAPSNSITRCIRINDDNGNQLSLPIEDSQRNRVIHYAKALYSYSESNENNVLNFQVDDILLLVEYINDDWYVGEVYQNPGELGLVPMNYVKIIA